MLTCRKIEIRYVPYNSFIPSILHMTGSWSHNVSLRNIASKQKPDAANVQRIIIILRSDLSENIPIGH